MIVVTAGVIVEGRQVLIAQRHADDTMGGMWEFPGGRVEKGETPDMGIVRELKEELDVQATPVELIDALPGANGKILLLFYRCTMQGTPRPVDCADVRMVDVADLHLYNFAPADRFIANKLYRSLHRSN